MNDNITVNGKHYQWDEDNGGFFGYETSCGVYGAVLNIVSRKWNPAWIANDDYEAQAANEEYNTPEEAIERSHYFFS